MTRSKSSFLPFILGIYINRNRKVLKIMPSVSNSFSFNDKNIYMYTTENKNKNHEDNAISFKSFFFPLFSFNDKNIYTAESKNIKILKITPFVSSSFSSNDKNKYPKGNRHENPEEIAICFKFDFSSDINYTRLT